MHRADDGNEKKKIFMNEWIEINNNIYCADPYEIDSVRSK